MASEPHGSDKAWTTLSISAVAAILVVASLFGFIVIPVVQGKGIGLDAWTAICRAMGLQPGSPARPQPTSEARAQPVSQVAWRPDILNGLVHADREAGAKLVADVCSACHGAGGLSTDPQYPFLSGQSAAAIYKQLHDYKSGARVHELMTPVAQQLSEKQMADVAAFLSGKNAFGSLGPRWQVPDPETAKLVTQGDSTRGIPACNACHGTGVGGPIETPTLSGQHQEYIVRQLTLYAKGERRNDVYGRMRLIASRLTPAEMARVAHYYQGIR